jgi:hypothetical protein
MTARIGVWHPALRDLNPSERGVPDTGIADQRCQAPRTPTSSAMVTGVPGTSRVTGQLDMVSAARGNAS